MNIDTYIASAKKTLSCNLDMAVQIDGPVQVLLHSAVGLIGELVELRHAKFDDDVHYIEEIGDCCWYWAIGVDTLSVMGRSVQIIIPDRDRMAVDILNDAQAHAAVILDMCKKLVWYRADSTKKVKHPITGVMLPIIDHMVNAYSEVYRLLGEMCQLHGHPIETAFKLNIDKLSIRYKTGKFSEKEAVERDTSKEQDSIRSGLEQKLPGIE